jgi:DNA-binding transcriptional ArsR family regulator
MAPHAAQLIAALNHPIRRTILRAMDGGETASASDLALSLDKPLSRVSYHVNVLAGLDVLEPVRSRKVRGATEHFFRSTLNGRPAWARAALEASLAQDDPRAPGTTAGASKRPMDYRLRLSGGSDGDSTADGQPPA